LGLLQLGKQQAGFLGVPALIGPSQPLLFDLAVQAIAYAEVAVEFAVVAAFDMLSEADAGVNGALFAAHGDVLLSGSRGTGCKSCPTPAPHNFRKPDKRM
jgi:hypothetical protein